jgi:hypothetical protein
MSDQEGKIIDLPIQANFREGLSSIDYIISSYGARKGIVDTALKTADSGYLTRRLIYIAQDLVIRQKDCGVKKGLIILLKKNISLKNLIGRFLISKKSFDKKLIDSSFDSGILTEKVLTSLKDEMPLLLNIRSSLTCKLNGSICQNCYGWDLAQRKLISLGEAVGIIAAQSIGEPGTQLTMRTFHTGGIFTGELLTQIHAPFSGKLIFPVSLKTIPYRTPHGVFVLKLQQEISIWLINWEGKLKEIFLDINSFFYVNTSFFVKKGELIAEFMNQSILPAGRKLKPIFSPLSGEIRFQNLLVRKMFREKRTIKITQDTGILWLSSGKFFLFPKEIQFFNSKVFSQKVPFASLYFTFPYRGILSFSNTKLILFNEKKQFSLDFQKLQSFIKNTFVKISLFIKKYQYVDPFTLLGILNFFPHYQGKIYLVRKKNAKYKSVFFIVTEDDVWKISCDQINDFSFSQEKKSIIRSGRILNQTCQTTNCGFFLQKDGFKLIFQLAFPVFLSRGTLLNYKQGDFVLQKKVVANLVNYIQQTEDIVQGLPKIEELIEARKPKLKAYLAMRSGILINSSVFQEKKFFFLKRTLKDNILRCTYIPTNSLPSYSKRKQEKQLVSVTHSIFLKDPLIIFQNKIYKAYILPSFFKPKKKPIIGKEEYSFVDPNQQILLINGKITFSSWVKSKFNLLKKDINIDLFTYQNNTLKNWLKLKPNGFSFQNQRGDYILSTEQKGYIFLEYLNPQFEYEIPLTSKLITLPGNFIDIGEPFTEGMIDIHQLLHILVKYHSTLDGIMLGSLKGLEKFQLLLVNSIQAIYQSQGVNISSKHVEIIVRQMTNKIVIKESGDTPFLPGELIRLSFISQVYDSLKNTKTKIKFKLPKFEPLLLSSTTASLSKDGFLSSAGFQETKRVLTKAAIEGSSDWLRGLKECIIVGRMIPAGSTFLNYKNYLDNIYLFKT